MFKRWEGHCSSARSGSDLIFHKAIRKYGEDAFEHEVLEECDSLDKILERERYHIAKLNTVVPHGYNMTFGGEGNLMPECIKERHRKATSEGTKKAFQDPKVRKRHLIATRVARNKPEAKLRHKLAMEKHYASDAGNTTRYRQSESSKAMWKRNYNSLKETRVGSNNGRAVLNEDDVVSIKNAWNLEVLNNVNVGEFYRRMAVQYCVKPDTICHLIKGRTWSSTGPRLIGVKNFRRSCH